jgi:hypothetical protein
MIHCSGFASISTSSSRQGAILVENFQSEEVLFTLDTAASVFQMAEVALVSAARQARIE